MKNVLARKCALLTSALLIGITAVAASSIQQVTVEEMLKNSELVFEGNVIGVNSHFIGSGPDIETDISFQVMEVIKGSATPVIVLTFSGGTVGSATVSISDMHMPEYRQHGIYFVESSQRKQVHPFYGWEQGHFIVKLNRSGADFVTTRNGRAVIGLEPGKTMTGMSGGVAFGVQVADAESTPAALSAEQFKLQLRLMNARLQK